MRITWKYLSKWYHLVAKAEDQKGNALCRDLFNDWMLTPDGTREYPYGGIDHTVSHVTGVNKLANRMTWVGHLLAWMLNLIEKNHVEKAAQNKQYDD